MTTEELLKECEEVKKIAEQAINNGMAELKLRGCTQYLAELIAKLADKVRELETQARAVVIEEICQEYYQPIIDNFYAVRKQPDVGPYAYENDIKLYRKLQIELRKQEWVRELSK